MGCQDLRENIPNRNKSQNLPGYSPHEKSSIYFKGKSSFHGRASRKDSSKGSQSDDLSCKLTLLVSDLVTERLDIGFFTELSVSMVIFQAIHMTHVLARLENNDI